MGLRELLILLLILAIVGVILRGLYVALRARRGQLRMALDKNIPQYDPDELLTSELPNGGARLVQRSFEEVVKRNSAFTSRDQAIPVLMDTLDDDEPLDEPPRQSSVASARNAARQKHGMRAAAMKPVHRPIDRMAAAVAAAPVASSSAMSAPVTSAPAMSAPTQDDYEEEGFEADDYEEEAYDEEAYEEEGQEAERYDDDSDDDYDDEDAEDDDRDDDIDDNDDDQFDEDDEDDEEDELDHELDDALDDDQDDDQDDLDENVSWEEDQDGEDDEYEAEEFESVYGDDDTDTLDDDADDSADFETPAENESAASADTWYEEDDVPPVEEETKSGPRRWLQWAGEKLSGMGGAGHDKEHHGSADEPLDRTQRAEPVIGSASFDEEERPAARAPAAPVRHAREPLDKSRQKELSLDHPDDDILFDRAERAAEKATRREPPAKEKPRREKPVREPVVQEAPAPRREKPEVASAPRKEKPAPAPAARAEESAPVQDFSEVLVLNVVAKPDREIAGVDLLQVLLANQLRFGDMNIFHRHLESATSSPVIFSVANLVNPGTFDLNRISEFSTRGVCFFMTLPNVVNSMQAFDRMLDVAQQVRIALDADLKDDNRSVMTAQTIEHYRQRVRDFDLRQLRQPK